MRILILYATNSGSTYTAAQIIQEVLGEKGHEVQLLNARDGKLQDSFNYDFAIWGSPSWKLGNDEGAPHEAFVELMEQEQSIDLSGRRFAVYGCGDSDYTYFCGAVDKLKAFIESHHGQLVGEPLKLDSFFFNLDKTTLQTQEWALQLANQL